MYFIYFFHLKEKNPKTYNNNLINLLYSRSIYTHLLANGVLNFSK